MVATISFDRVDMVKPVYHGDLIRLEGEIIALNKSSMAIQVSGFRHDLPSGQFVHTLESTVTMVAIDRFGRKRCGLPELFDPDRAEYCMKVRDMAERRREQFTRWRVEQAAVDDLAFISKGSIASDDTKDEYAAISDTTIELRHWFLPRNLNMNNSLFGGDLLAWMVGSPGGSLSM